MKKVEFLLIVVKKIMDFLINVTDATDTGALQHIVSNI